MPIYAYRCASCGHSRDVLQKISDPQLTTCPVCGVEAFQKQITAAGFQLKGSGWYVTDFRDGGGKKAETASAPASSGDGAAKSSDAPAAAPAAPAPAPAPAAAPATGAKSTKSGD